MVIMITQEIMFVKRKIRIIFKIICPPYEDKIHEPKIFLVKWFSKKNISFFSLFSAYLCLQYGKNVLYYLTGKSIERKRMLFKTRMF